MKKILIPVSIIAVLLCTAAKDADQTVISPDRLFLADNGKSLFVTNRAGSELIKMTERRWNKKWSSLLRSTP